MTGPSIRWEDALRRLYDWFRSAPDDVIYTGWDKPGWVDASERTEALEHLAQVVNVADREGLDAEIAALKERDLSGALGFSTPTIRLTIMRRRARSKQLLFKFVIQPKKKVETRRDRLPPSIVQTALFGTDTRASTEQTVVGPSLADEGLLVGPSGSDATATGIGTGDGPTSPDYGTSSAPDEMAIEWHNDAAPTDDDTDVSRHTIDAVPHDQIVYSNEAIVEDLIDVNHPDAFGWDFDESATDRRAEELEEAKRLAAMAKEDAEGLDLAKSVLRQVEETKQALAEAKRARFSTFERSTTSTWGEASMAVSLLMRERGAQMMTATGNLLVCKPSPGTGKTHAMIELAIAYHRARKRVVFSIFAKPQLEELRDRFRRADGSVALRVITGRGPDNCHLYPQVEATSKAGYRPGHAVCMNCDYYPMNVKTTGMQVCGYYSERIKACQEFNQARRGARRYPVILTTHKSAVLGQSVTKSSLGTFWHTDFVFFDEDCSNAFDTEHVIRKEHLRFMPRQQHHPIAGFNAAISEAMRLAEQERETVRRNNWKAPAVFDPNKPRFAPKPHPIHGEHGSAYVGQDLRDLLERVYNSPHVQRFYPRHDQLSDVQGLTTRLTSHHEEQPPAGEFEGKTPQQIESDYPHKDITILAAMLDEEWWDLQATKKAQGQPQTYAVRLENVVDRVSGLRVWQLAALKQEKYRTKEHNIIIGDAYADPMMYKRLFPDQRLDVIDVQAHWPRNTFCFSILSHATKSDVGNSRDQFRHFLETHTSQVLEGQRNRRVLLYTHMTLAPWMEEWLFETESRWGMKEWAVQHYGSGRGIDTYLKFDTMIAATEYLPNMGGLVHITNALHKKEDRVEHWSGERQRKGKQTFGQSLDDMDPRLKGMFQRKCTDELAQAIHRIRPAIPREDGEPPKQIFVFRKHVPLANDLLSATTSYFVRPGETGYEETPADAQKGKRAMTQSLVGFVNPEEMARAIRVTRDRLGFWGHFCAHALTALVWSDSSLANILSHGEPAQADTWGETNMPMSNAGDAGLGSQRSSLNQSPATQDSMVSALCDRIRYPSRNWDERAGTVRDSRAYRSAMELLMNGDALGSRSDLRAPWTRGGNNFVVWGEAKAAQAALMAYEPKLLGAEAPF